MQIKNVLQIPSTSPRDDTRPDAAKGGIDGPRAGNPPSKTLRPLRCFFFLSLFPPSSTSACQLFLFFLSFLSSLSSSSLKNITKKTITMAATRVFTSRLATAMAPAARPSLRAAVPKRTFTNAAFRPAQRSAAPFQSMKRQQPSTLLQANARQVFANVQSRRQYSSEIAQAMVAVSQNVGMGSAAIGLGGAGIGIGLVFAALLLSVSRNPALRGQLFTYAILGFAFVEAMGLFDLMVAMMCKYV